MTDLSLGEMTQLNQMLSMNSIRKGTIHSLPNTENFPFLVKLNEDTPFKLPEFMKSVETHKSYTNRESRITKVMWVMDLVDNKRVLYYANPNSKKVLHNNKLQSEEILNASKPMVPSNVQVLWRLDATYYIENEQEVFYSAELRKYA